MAQELRESITLRPGDALSVTDVQNDFLPGGTLGVPGGDTILSPLNRIIALFKERNLPIFFTRDWHPPDHSSFIEHGGPWPPHCVQNTRGAEFASQLTIPEDAIIISKGMQKEREQYSTMYGCDEHGYTEVELMKRLGVRRVFIGGLATEYCVLNSVKDALSEGFEVVVITDGVAAVNVNPGDGERALEEMASRGAKLVSSKTIEG